MLRFLQTKGFKNLPILTAAEELTRGEVVTKSTADGSVSSITAGMGEYLVDTPKAYTGEYSVVNPTDSASDTIASGAKCVVVTPMLGERYATTMKNFAAAKIGAPLTAALGKFIRAAGQATYHWVYGGEYSDPTGTMYIVERVAPATTAATRTLTYNANGGTGTMADPYSPYYQGDTAEVLPSTFTPPAYKDFVEYDTVADGSGTAYDPGDPVTIGASNIVLYAQYEDTHTKLVFDANTGSGTMTDITKYYVDDVIVIPECTLTPPVGNIFDKWNTAANGSGTSYDPDDEVAVTADMIGAATKLYAIWTVDPEA